MVSRFTKHVFTYAKTQAQRHSLLQDLRALSGYDCGICVFIVGQIQACQFGRASAWKPELLPTILFIDGISVNQKSCVEGPQTVFVLVVAISQVLMRESLAFGNSFIHRTSQDGRLSG